MLDVILITGFIICLVTIIAQGVFEYKASQKWKQALLNLNKGTNNDT